MPKYSVGFAVGLWVERTVEAENLQAALQKANTIGFGLLVKPMPGTSVNDFRVDVVSATDLAAVDKIGL
jgi:hypothetical protein